MRLLVTMLLLTAGSANALAADFLGGLYATTQDDRLIRFNADGSYVTVLSGLPDPKGLEFGDAQSAYITCQTYQAGSEYGSLRIFDPNGVQTFFADGIPATNRSANGTYAAGVAVDTNGSAYIATHNSPGMTRVDLDGTVTDFTGTRNELWWGRQAAIAPQSGKLYTSNWIAGGVFEVDKTTGNTTLAAPGLSESGGIAFDDNDNLYISEFNTNTVWVLTPEGSLTSLATVPYANYSAFGNGHLYVSEFNTSVGTTNIWKVDPSTGATTLFSTAPFLDDLAFLSAPVPEPSSIALLGIALAAIASSSKRLRRNEPSQSLNLLNR